MTGLLTRPVSASHRLLGPPPEEPLLHLDSASLIALLEEAGLTGRGGAGFPTARKLAAVSGRQAVVVGNAMEGEPLSSKDQVLLSRSPGLVVDGLSLIGSALGAGRTILAVGPRAAVDPVRAAAGGTRVEVRPLVGGFVAGQESALVNRLNGRAGVPTDPLVPVYRHGVDGQPTLVLNAETLAQVALVARRGAPWFRSLGTPADPGTFLTTITATHESTMTHPGVLEVPRGTPLRHLLLAAGTDLDRVAAVLIGGYHGAWVPGADLDVLLTRDDLARFDATPGAGVVHVLDRTACPLSTAATIAAYLAGQSARQCGPCVNGLPRMAHTLGELAVPGARPGLVLEVERLRSLVAGRGACGHPEGTARFVASTMRVFADHVDRHLEGACDAGTR